MQLRDYQVQCVNSVIQEARNGHMRQVIVLATGLGKTVIFSQFPSLVKKKGLKTLILAHREELLTQARDKLLSVDSTLRIGIEQGQNKIEDDVDVVIASVPTLGRANSQRILKFKPEEFGLIIVDECFVAGTKIDGKTIEDIQVGDYVNSFNETTRRIEKKRVVRLFKNPAKSLLKISLSNGQNIVCTPNHPFYVQGQWVSANKLALHDVLTNTTNNLTITSDARLSKIYNRKNLRRLWEKIQTSFLERYDVPDMFPRLQASANRRKTEKSKSSLYSMWKNYSIKGEGAKTSSKGKSLLFSLLQKRISKKGEFGNYVKNQSEIRLRKDEEKKSDAESRVRKENGFKNERTDFFRERGEWSNDQTPTGVMEASTIACRSTGISYYGNFFENFLSISSKLLQSGYRYTRSKISHRGRRKISQAKEVEVSGQKENGGTEQIRVDGIKVLERGSGHEFEQMCPDGNVYNFEVEGNNNYFANGILVHNCHHACSESYMNVFKHFGVLKDGTNTKCRIVLLGVTATPNRSDHQGLDKIFDKITFSYTLKQGITNGYLANIEAFTVDTNSDISKVKSVAGDFSEKELSEAVNNEERNKLIVDSYSDIAPHSKALVFAVDVEHTKVLTQYFKAAGYKAEFVIGETPTDQRTAILDGFKNGDIEVVVNCMVLTEGYDNPGIETILMARPTKSSVAFSQMIGRGTRLHENKSHLRLIDFVDNTGKNSVMGLPCLFGIPKQLKNNKGKFITELIEKVDKIKEVNPEYPIENIDDWDDENIDKIIKKVDIFSQAQIPQVVKEYSKYVWEAHLEGFRIQFPVDEETGCKDIVKIEKDMLGNFQVKRKVLAPTVPSFTNGYSKWMEKSESVVGHTTDLQSAFTAGDDWITGNKSNFSNMFSQESSWRNDKPSEGQLNILRKNRIAIPAKLTKGQASVLISKIFANKGQNKLTSSQRNKSYKS